MEKIYLLMEEVAYCLVGMPDEHFVVSAHKKKPRAPKKRMSKDGTTNSYFYVAEMEVK